MEMFDTDFLNWHAYSFILVSDKHLSPLFKY